MSRPAAPAAPRPRPAPRRVRPSGRVAGVRPQPAVCIVRAVMRRLAGVAERRGPLSWPAPDPAAAQDGARTIRAVPPAGADPIGLARLRRRSSRPPGRAGSRADAQLAELERGVRVPAAGPPGGTRSRPWPAQRRPSGPSPERRACAAAGSGAAAPWRRSPVCSRRRLSARAPEPSPWAPPRSLAAACARRLAAACGGDDDERAPTAQPAAVRRSSASSPRTCSRATRAYRAPHARAPARRGRGADPPDLPLGPHRARPRPLRLRASTTLRGRRSRAPACDLLPILFTPPRVPRGKPARRRTRHLPARAPEDMAAVRRRGSCARYGPERDFWKAHPDLPKHADPRLAGVERAEPARLLADGPDAGRVRRACSTAVGRAIKRADPRRGVVSAGLSESRQGIPFEDFVQRHVRRRRGRRARRVRAARVRARRGRLGGRGGDHTRAAARSWARHADLDHRVRLGQRRAAQPVHGRRGGAGGASPRGAEHARRAAARSSGCRASSTSTGATPRVTRAGRTSSALHTGLLDSTARPKPALTRTARVR